jgi:hypothetical protein
MPGKTNRPGEPTARVRIRGDWFRVENDLLHLDGVLGLYAVPVALRESVRSDGTLPFVGALRSMAAGWDAAANPGTEEAAGLLAETYLAPLRAEV